MAITKSAKKAHRASQRKRVFNVRRMDALRDITKQFKKLISLKKKKEALSLIPAVYKAFDKAAKTHAIPRGRADRKKSRLAALINSTVRA